jgi:hypothetical protein
MANSAFLYIRGNNPASATKWLTGLFEAIARLEDFPSRCPLIPEAEELNHPARHLLYGKGLGTYRIIFDIDESLEHPLFGYCGYAMVIETLSS